MTVSPSELVPPEFLSFAEKLADASRALILSRFRQQPDIVMKPDDTPVTETDLEVEALIRSMILAEYPDHGIIGEEHPANVTQSDYIWVIDPIDGTRAFIAGRPVFGTLIALTYKGAPIMGVVDIPVMQERWLGARGHPTTLNGVVAKSRTCPNMTQAILLATSPEYLGGNAAKPFANVEEQVRFTIYDTGTQGYGLIASGHGDIMIAATYGIVDYLAAVPVIEGAGGAIRDWNGEPLTIHSGDRFVAVGNVELLPTVLALLQDKAEEGQTSYAQHG